MHACEDKRIEYITLLGRDARGREARATVNVDIIHEMSQEGMGTVRLRRDTSTRTWRPSSEGMVSEGLRSGDGVGAVDRGDIRNVMGGHSRRHGMNS